MRNALASEFLYFRSTRMPSGEYEFLMFSGSLFAYAYLGEAEIAIADWNDVLILVHNLQAIMVESMIRTLTDDGINMKYKKGEDYTPQRRKAF